MVDMSSDKPPLYPGLPIPSAPPPMFHGQVGPQGPVVLPMGLGGESQRMTCPFCRADIFTNVKYRAGRINHISAILLLITGFICCVCVPYCVDSCKDVEHICPNCERYIGNYRR